MEPQMPVAGTAALVVNTASRRGREAFEPACRQMLGHGLDLVAAYPVRKPKQLVPVIEREMRKGTRLIVVGGGDGTVTMVSRSFLRSGSVMGLLPLGTGNSFAQGIALPLDLEGAIATLVTGKVAEVDLGIVNGRTFANFTTIGLSTMVARETKPLIKRILGPVAYVVTGVLLAGRHRAFDVRIDADDGVHRFRTHQLVIANGRVFGATPIHPDARVDDGRLIVFAVPGASRRQIRRTWTALLAGRQAALEDAVFISSKHLMLETKPRRAIDMDGEIATRTPATFSVASRSLRIVVPQSFVASEP
jgi:YegS/Rv2252/BmrU family lipid kinase